MFRERVTQRQVLEELQDLEQGRWFEVLDFIGFLKEQANRQPEDSGPQPLTARALLQSKVVGLWADREDIGDSLDFARQLRRQAEHRRAVNLETIEPYFR
jgi:hypothetical protein